jgi:hypothetical protein
MIGLYTSPLFNSILPERIGYVIQQRRKLLGLTQEKLARRTHFSKHRGMGFRKWFFYWNRGVRFDM